LILDSFLPQPHVSERHALEIPADPAVVYRAVWEADLGGHPLIRLLLAIRSLPARFGSSSPRLDHSPVTLSVIVANGFRVLAEDPGREVVLGAVGRFWRPTGNLLPFDAERFTAPLERGLAKAAWNFTVSRSATGTVLSTETRVACADPETLRRFRIYWFVVRPFSGAIRVLMLRAVRRHVAGTSSTA